MKYFYYITAGLSILIIAGACSSSAFLSKGDEAYDRLRYQDAIKNYEKYLKKEDDPEAMIRLAESYRLTDQFERAEHWYSEAVQYPPVDSEVKYKYASVLLANGHTDKAREWASEYLEDKPRDARGQTLMESIESQDELMESEKAYELSSAPFNSEFADYAPIYFEKELIFISDRKGKTDPWTGRAFHELYQTTGGRKEAGPLRGDLGGNYHNGAATLSSDGTTMFFTRSYNKKEKGKGDVVRLSILKAKNVDGEWVEDEKFPYNSPDYNTMHPALSKDDKMIVFVSDRSGVGGRDLFYCEKRGGQWTEPKNLLAPVNTPGNESFPYLDAEGTLYFASDGHSGLGGYDLYSTRFEDGFWTQPKHLGGELNSRKDDISLISDDGLKTGYFASNRNSEDGTDDIYHFNRVSEPIPLNGLVVDKYTQIPLPNVEITITNLNSANQQTVSTDADGRFSSTVDPESEFRVQGELNEIKTTMETFETYGITSDDPQFVKLLHNDPRFTLNGRTIERKTKEPVEGVRVTLYNVNTNEEIFTHSDANGDFNFQLEQNTDYQISGEKDSYFSSVQEATTKGLDRTTTLYVKLFLTIEEIIIGKPIKLDEGEIGEYEFDHILYDFDDWRIRPDAAKELDKLVKLLKENPSISIELGSHTDSRGGDSYNMKLSQKRAESAVDYLVDNGIKRTRLTAKGYGESLLVNKCDDGENCTEEEHQQNRRTEIKVLSI